MLLTYISHNWNQVKHKEPLWVLPLPMIHCTTHTMYCRWLLILFTLWKTDGSGYSIYWQSRCSSAAISISTAVHTTLSDADDDDDDDDSSPVAGCLARAGRAVWAQSTSWKWATRAHNSTRRIWRRAAAGTDTRRSISGGRSRSRDLWLWSTEGTWRPVRPGTAGGPSRLRSARSRHTHWNYEPLTPKPLIDHPDLSPRPLTDHLFTAIGANRSPLGEMTEGAWPHGKQLHAHWSNPWL